MLASVDTFTDEDPPRDTLKVVLVDVSFSPGLNLLVVVIGVVVFVVVLLALVV